MEQPPDFLAQGSLEQFASKKGLQDLKQFPRGWIEKFSDAVIEFRIHDCHFGYSVFTLIHLRGSLFWLCILDDIVATGSDFVSTCVKTFFIVIQKP